MFVFLSKRSIIMHQNDYHRWHTHTYTYTNSLCHSHTLFFKSWVGASLLLYVCMCVCVCVCVCVSVCFNWSIYFHSSSNEWRWTFVMTITFRRKNWVNSGRQSFSIFLLLFVSLTHKEIYMNIECAIVI